MSNEQNNESAVSRSQFTREEQMAKEKEAPKKVSRKEFVKGAAAVASVGALASCAPAATPTTAPEAAPTCPPAEECAPCPTPWLPEKWDQEVDVLVAGAGISGLPAAIEAIAAGADVLLIEKGDFVGGLAATAGPNNFMCNTHVQRRLGVEDQIEWGIADEMLINDYRAPIELVRTYVEGGADTCLWLEQLGIEWDDDLGSGKDLMFGTGVARNHTPKESPNYPNPNGAAYIYVMLEEAKRLGVPISLNHGLRRIYREPNGPVLGVEVVTDAGTINIKARKAVVLATGGFTTNELMEAAVDPRIVGDAFYSDGLPYTSCMGEGILAGLDIGAGVADLDRLCLVLKLGSHIYKLWEPRELSNYGSSVGLGSLTKEEECERIILVKGDGERYINEAEGAVVSQTGQDFSKYPELPFMATFLSLPNPKNVWAVTDAEGAAALGWPEDEMRDPQPLAGRALWPDSVAVADTLADLASKIGINAASLEATVSRYNGFVDAGVDDDFGKPMPMYRISEPPFFAAKFNVIRHTGYGGLRINSKAQVLERSEWSFDDSAVTPDELLAENCRAEYAKNVNEEKAIPHLYAIGEAAANTGWRRYHRQQGLHVVWGRIAGKNAAAETSLS